MKIHATRCMKPELFPENALGATGNYWEASPLKLNYHLTLAKTVR